MSEKEIQNTKTKEVVSPSSENLFHSKSTDSPDVDVYISEEDLLLIVDLPGVEKIARHATSMPGV